MFSAFASFPPLHASCVASPFFFFVYLVFDIRQMREMSEEQEDICSVFMLLISPRTVQSCSNSRRRKKEVLGTKRRVIWRENVFIE